MPAYFTKTRKKQSAAIAVGALVVGLAILAINKAKAARTTVRARAVSPLPTADQALVARYADWPGPFELHAQHANGNELAFNDHYARFEQAVLARNAWCAKNPDWSVWIMSGSGGLVGSRRQC